MLLAALTVLVIGGLTSLYFFSEDAYCIGARRGPLALIFTISLVFMLLIGATSRFWFKHLWHHRSGYRYG
jgi:putative copper export protein